jgi:hypothetical protein
LHARLYTLPSFAVYLTHRAGLFLALHSGFLQLSGESYTKDGSATVGLTASTISFGAGLGYEYDLGRRLSLYLELAYHVQFFPALDYNDRTIAGGLGIPRRWNLSGLLLTAGMQFKIQKR